jgi:amidase
VHEFFPEAALAQAKSLDDYFESNKGPVGPLHGLPVSLKDQLRIKVLHRISLRTRIVLTNTKGVETSMGYISWLGKYDTRDSVLTSLLRKAGAVFYVKTSVPQTLMVCETINNIVGRTTNPRNRDLSCGGSSGGEGAIVAMRGAVMGVGTDSGRYHGMMRVSMNLFDKWPPIPLLHPHET